MPLHIRPIDFEEDSERVITYAQDLFAISFANPSEFSDQFGDDGAKYLRWLAEKQASSPENAGLVLLRGEPVGMVVVGPWSGDQEVGYVYHYYLEPRARGRGLAAGMDDHAVRTLRRVGRSQARLSVAETNTRALHFYLRRGWRHVGPRLDQPGILYMQKALAEPEPANCSATQASFALIDDDQWAERASVYSNPSVKL